MSVLIKGMEMPKNCEECEFHLIEDIAFELIHQCQINHGYIDNADICGFPYDCPLVELPKKHGRLIDAGEICFSMTNGTDQDIAEEAVREAMTVIEAEDE